MDKYVKKGVIAGVTWLFISLVIDLLLFLPASPMQMSLTNYIMDIGITYLMVPIITIGFGYLLNKKLIPK